MYIFAKDKSQISQNYGRLCRQQSVLEPRKPGPHAYLSEAVLRTRMEGGRRATLFLLPEVQHLESLQRRRNLRERERQKGVEQSPLLPGLRKP
jgi:hypothetical protein